MHLRRLVLGLALLAGPAAAAGDAEPELDRVLHDLALLMDTRVEVSSRRDTTLLSTPSTVSILDRATLERYGVRTLAEAVELVSGMSTVRTTFVRDLPTARGILQEHYANRILLLIDGVPTWMASTGAFSLGRVDLADVERIEVLKGPASVLYGSNAFAGAINVVLRRPHANGGAAHAGIQDQGGWQAGAQAHLAGEGWSALLSANGHQAYGEHLELPGEAGTLLHSAEALENRSADLSVQAGNHRFLANVFRSAFPHLGNLVRPSGGSGQPYETDGALLDYGYGRRLGRGLSLRYDLALDRYGLHYGTSQDGTNARRAHAERLTHTLGALWDLSEHLNLEAGLTRETRTSRDFQTWDPATGAVLDENHLRDVSVSASSASLQANYVRGRWNLLAGSRWTRDGNFGTNTSTRATAVYALGERSSLKLIWGQSFRAPNMLEQYTLVPGALYGNRDLRPETSDSLELGYVVQAGAWVLQAQAYRTLVRDKILRLPRYPRSTSDPADVSSEFDNGPTFATEGLELELQYEDPGGFGGFLALDLSRGDRGDQVPSAPGWNAKFVPPWHLRSGLSRSFGPWTAALLLQHQAPVDGPLAPIPSWTDLGLNLSLVQRFRSFGLRHALTLRNAADQERWYPEYVRRNINRIPDGMGRQAAYVVTLRF